MFRKAIASTGAELTRPDPQGQLLHRVNEHVCRVSGSQFLTRLGYPLETVQLIGRWGSDAVRRYVQEAPLSCASGSSARPCISKTPTQRTVRTMVKKYLETITSKFWVKNTSTNVIHISGAPEFSTENIHWQTLCGWRYGQAPHTRFWSLPEARATSVRDASACKGIRPSRTPTVMRRQSGTPHRSRSAASLQQVPPLPPYRLGDGVFITSRQLL